MQRADDGNRHRKDGEVGHHVDAGDDVPNGTVVQAKPLDVRIPEFGNRHADEGKEKAEGDAPAYEKAETVKDELPENRIRENAPILKEDGDFGQADGNVIDDDGTVERLLTVSNNRLDSCSPLAFM